MPYANRCNRAPTWKGVLGSRDSRSAFMHACAYCRTCGVEASGGNLSTPGENKVAPCSFLCVTCLTEAQLDPAHTSEVGETPPSHWKGSTHVYHVSDQNSRPRS